MPSRAIIVLIKHYNLMLRNKDVMAGCGGTYMIPNMWKVKAGG